MATKIKDMQSLFIHELTDLYSAEKQLTKALPKMAQAATDQQLRQAFEAHLKETEDHVDRLEQILEQTQTGLRGHKCEAMEGLVEEGKDVMDQDAPPPVLDAALICAAQRVEHYEIAGYGCARTFAEQLGLHDAARLLQQTLDEEKAADETLNKIAMQRVNEEALNTARH